MPANLTPQYRAAEERFRQAKTTEEKIEALEEMLAVIPKHKGTEHIQGDIKARIAKLRRQLEEQKPSHGRYQAMYSVEKEGGGQIVLVGPPNVGKSKLLSMLTNAQPEIADYAYTTQKPLPGMMPYEDIKIQIVDMPPVTEEFTEPWMAAIIRNADAALLVLDVSDSSVLEVLERTLLVMEKFRLRLHGWDRLCSTEQTGVTSVKPTILVANRMDLADSQTNLDILHEFYGERFPITAVSSVSGQGLEDLKREVFRMLDIVRVYTKVPGKAPAMDMPYVLRRGSTVLDLATMVHKDFSEKLRFARIWGEGKYDGQMVSRDHVLEDRDILELHV